MSSRWVLPGAMAVIVIAALAAVMTGGFATLGTTPLPSGASSSAPASSAAGPTGSGTAGPTGSGSGDAGPLVVGTALPAFATSSGDVALGKTAPVVRGYAFDGTPVTLAEPGRPQLIIFVAHWCPHCQREVPLIQAWLDAKGMPVGVDLRSVATGIDPTRPNYPPETWLATERWTVPVVVDPTNSIATAFGLSGYPYFVFLDAKGQVALRASGELTIATLEQLIGALAGA